jgi:hypothetical protein
MTEKKQENFAYIAIVAIVAIVGIVAFLGGGPAKIGETTTVGGKAYFAGKGAFGKGFLTGGNGSNETNVTCYSDNDCPADGYVGNYFCSYTCGYDGVSDVSRTYRDWRCINPGTPYSGCVYNETPVAVDCCYQGEYCQDGVAQCLQNQTGYCYDSDGGFNLSVKGYVNASEGLSGWDYCVGQNTLFEGYCLEDYGIFEMVNCTGRCRNGRCIGPVARDKKAANLGNSTNLTG